MRIERLELQNYRCFERRTIEFPTQFNVLIGDNGTGKTTIVAAVTAILGRLLEDAARLDDTLRPQADDVRRFMVGPPGAQTLATAKLAELSALVTLPEYGVTEPQEMVVTHEPQGLVDTRLGAPQPVWAVRGGLDQRVKEKIGLALRGGAEPLPVVAVFDTASTPPDRAPAVDEVFAIKPWNRRDGYQECLGTGPANVLDMYRWFVAGRGAGLEAEAAKSEPPGIYTAVQVAVQAAMADWRQAYFSFSDRELYAVRKDGDILPFHLLSDGYRRVFAIVADIARRAAMLNPHLGAEAVRRSTGVVAIDELDLHLHPSWQREIVGALKRAFPNIQFIATTHSPFIIQSLAPGEVIALEAEAGQPTHPYANRSIEDIAEKVMGIDMPSRSERMQALWKGTQEFQALLQQNGEATPERVAAADAKLNELMAPFAAEPSALALYAFLDSERKAAGLGAEA